jgi:hypothetical protein
MQATFQLIANILQQINYFTDIKTEITPTDEQNLITKRSGSDRTQQ